MDTSVPSDTGRKLLDQAQYMELCANTNLTKVFDPSLEKAYSKFSTLVANFTFAKEDQTDNIRRVFIQKDTAAVSNLVFGVLAGFLAFWILFIITFICWMVYIGCCCRTACCCKGTEIEKGCSIQLVFFIICSVVLAAMVAVSIAGWVLASKVPEKLDDTECTLMRFYLDVKDGEIKTTTPKWVGITGVENKINSLVTNLEKLMTESQGAFRDTSYVNSDRTQYFQSLDNSYSIQGQKRTSSPRPNGGNNFAPGFIEVIFYLIYIQIYGPRNTDGTTVFGLAKEFDETLVGASNLIEQLRTQSSYINANINTAKGSLNTIKNNLDPMKTRVDAIATDYIDPYITFVSAYVNIYLYDQKGNSTNSLNKLFIALFAISLGIAIVFFLFTTFFIWCEIKWMRYVSHVFWHLLTFFTIPIFMLAGAFGVLGAAMIYIKPVFEVVFSKEGLNVVFSGNTQMVDIMDTCMNQGGDLRPLLAPQNDMTNTLDSFIQASFRLNALNDQLTTIKGSPLANTLKDQYVKMETDIALDTSTSADSAVKVLSDLTKNTDYNVPESPQSACSSNTYDQWVTNSQSCSADYTFIDSSNTANNIGSNTCMNILLWDETKARARYADRPSCTGLNIADVAGTYVASLNKYAKDASNILQALSKDMEM